MPRSEANRLRPKIGLLTTGHAYYWSQFPSLKDKGLRMQAKLCEILETIGDVLTPGLVDTIEESRRAGETFQREKVDIVFVFPLGYCTGMVMIPAIKDLQVPVRILNAHEDRRYDYPSADTAQYLHHEGVCCIPEFSGTLVGIGKKFRVRTGPFDDERLWNEIRADADGAATARFFKDMAVGLIGNTYTNMVDMPIDEHRFLRATGHLLVRPEIEEIKDEFQSVTALELKDMLEEFRTMNDVDETVTDEHLTFSAQAAVAYDKVIHHYDIQAFGYYWWGKNDLTTQLRAQSSLAVSRLAALGRPGVTEGDVKTAMAMKVFDLLGAGGMFVEFFAMDFDDNTILFGHDGPSNVNMSNGRPRLMHLDVHHGKSGHALGYRLSDLSRPGDHSQSH